MTNRGLNRRLRHRSRRAGFMIGVSMVLTIAVCIGGFSVIYASLDPFVGDFVSGEGTTGVAPTEPPAQVAAANTVAQATAPPGAPAPAPTVAPQSPVPTQATFTPDFQTSNQYSLRLRSEPSADGPDSTIVTVLPPASPIQYLNEDQPAANPAQDGDRWMHFRTENGKEGWLREIDIEAYQP